MPADSPDVSPILALPYIQPSQAQKHVTHNEALRRLDVLVQLRVEGFGAETPPSAPEEGEVHALGAAPTGAWAGEAATLAAWIDGGWTFLAPQEGWRAWGRAEGELRIWNGAAWVLPPAKTDDLDGVGIGTSADAVNRLAVKAPATLFSHDGAGHQVKINKAAAGDTASVLFQSGWTGHAEIGLAGDTDLSVKVSDDGTSWAEAMRIDGAGLVAVRDLLVSGPGDRDVEVTTTNDQDARIKLRRPNGRSFEIVNEAGTFKVMYGASGATGEQTILSATDHALILKDPADSTSVATVKDGRLGVGTTAPANALHLKAPASALMRLESGATYNARMEFCPGGSTIEWTMGANDTPEFSIYDAVTAVTPFRIYQGAVANSLALTSTGVGMGLSSPNTKLQVSGQAWFGDAWYSSTAKVGVRQDSDAPTLLVDSNHATQTANTFLISTERAASASYNMMVAYSGGYGDLEFKLSGDGNGTCDGSWTGGGADYAEYFEWADGNPLDEDRRGLSVVLEGDRIAVAQPGDDPFGVVSANPSVIGDGDMDRWKGKYLRDDFGAYIFEDYEVIAWVESVADADGVREEARSCAADAVPDDVTIPADAIRTTHRRRRLNPAHDPDRPYTPRAGRPEWATIGLMGKLRLRKGQPVGSRWIRMRDVSTDVEEWLVR